MSKTLSGNSRQKFFLALKLYRKEKKYAKRYLINLQIQKLNNLQSNSPKEFWQILQNMKNERKINHAEKIKPGVWYDYIIQKNINKVPESEEQTLKDFIKSNNRTTFNELDVKITAKELTEALSNLKNNKSPGLDQISNEMLKNGTHQVNATLLNLFNKVFVLGIYPSIWAQGLLTNIHKKGSFMDPNNYRGITITSSVGKLLNSILSTRLQGFLRKYNLLSISQIGFEKNSSTADHILTLRTIIDKYTQNSQKLYACFVDFKQAFDTVWHTGLLSKLKTMGIQGFFFKIIESMYSKTQIGIKINNFKVTEFIKSEVGVKQGDNLSPLLFNIFINDLPKYIDKEGNTDPVYLNQTALNCLLYADDVVLFSRSKEGLQRCINGLEKFTNKWFLQVNLDKTKTIIFNKRGKFLKEQLSLGPYTIECCDRYTYLGLELVNCGQLTSSIKKLCEKGLKALYKLYKLLNSNYGISTMLHVFNHTIKPILLYGAEVWGIDLAKLPQHHINKDFYFERKLEDNPLAHLELKFYKRLLNVKRTTATLATRGELGIHPITIEAIGRSLKYLNSINQKNRKLVFHALQENITLSQANPQLNTWYNKITSLAEALQVTTQAASATKHGLKKFSKSIQSKMKQNYNTFWYQELNKSAAKSNMLGGNKLRTYNKLKVNFAPEPYLTIVDNNDHRSAITQLRVSSHPLHIESQRGTVQNPKNRLCPFCSDPHMEDEFHFIMECPTYTEYRAELNTLFDNTTLQQLNKRNKFLWLLTNESKPICKHLGKFLFNSFQKRKALINQRDTRNTLHSDP